MEVERPVNLGLLPRRGRMTLFRNAFENLALMRLAEPSRWASEDPFTAESWPVGTRIGQLEGETDAALRRQQQRDAFEARYTVTGKQLANTGGHMGAIFCPLESVLEELADSFRRVIPGGGRLLLRGTPLHRYLNDRYNEDQTEIYNEIRIAYFLRELVHGYSTLLSIHFMTVFDWWIARGDAVPMAPTIRPFFSSEYYQFTVVEALDETLWRWMRRTMPSLDAMRVVLFQLFNALEIAWLTHRFVHGDMHSDNVMLKVCDDSLTGHNLLYRRYNDPDVWYVLPANLLDGRIVKLIDFGRSHIRAPTSWSKDTPLGGQRHQHEGRIGPGRRHDGRGVNARKDTRVFFLRTLVQDDSFDRLWEQWERDSRPEEFLAFVSLVERAIEFERLLNYIGRAKKKRPVTNLAEARLNGWIRGVNVETADHWASSTESWGLTASEVLNSEFFAPLRRTDVSPEASENVVVSFATSFKELNARLGSDETVEALVTEPTPPPSSGDRTLRDYQRLYQFHAPVECCDSCGTDVRDGGGGGGLDPELNKYFCNEDCQCTFYDRWRL